MKEIIKSIARPAVKKCVNSYERCLYGNLYVHSIELTNNAISTMLEKSQPASIGKMGGNELLLVRRYLDNISPDSTEWKKRMHRMHVWSGIFPEETELMRAYCRAFLESLGAIDLLAVYFNYGEARLVRKYCGKGAFFGNPLGVEPFDHDDPWTKRLEGKNVLVIHPFKDSIQMQYQKRDLIWGARELLPAFNLMQIKMPLSNALVPSSFGSWKELLDDIKRQMDSFDYDVAIIGAGAYSLLIAEHAKRSGKIGIHIGGCVQMLFGIYGSRWLSNPKSVEMLNEHWVRPLPEETPETSNLVENACYW